MGYYGTLTPGVILRNVLENPAWYTAYTPYQPEISQGRLEALLNFQTMVSDLTGHGHRQRLDARRGHRRGRGDDPGAAASTRHDGLRRSSSTPTATPRRSRWSPPGPSRSASRSVVGDPATDLVPGRRLRRAAAAPRLVRRGARPAAGHRRPCTRPAAWPWWPPTCWPARCSSPPGELGADVAVGSAQRFGVPMGFGGPHAGFLATRDAYKRSLPGRLVGVSVDAAGRPALPPGPADPRAAHPPGEGHVATSAPPRCCWP